jgi:hypothetical protein
VEKWRFCQNRSAPIAVIICKSKENSHQTFKRGNKGEICTLLTLVCSCFFHANITIIF